MEAENNPVISSARGSRPGSNQENEGEVELEVEEEMLRLKKFGCGSRMVTWVSCLGWYGLALSLLSLQASIVLVLTPWVFRWFCGADTTCTSITVSSGVIAALFSLLWIFFSVRMLRRNQDRNSAEIGDLVKTGCFVIACLQGICGGYIFTTYTVSLMKRFSILQDIPVETLAEDIICILGSLAFVTFSSLLINDGVLRKKTKPVQAYFIFSLILECFLIIKFSRDINSSGMELSQLFLPVFGLIVTLIHLSYCNGLVILHYNILLHDMGFYKKNLEFFNEAFRIQV